MKKTMKITWITVDPNTNVEVNLVELGHLIKNKEIRPKFNLPNEKLKRDQMKFQAGPVDGAPYTVCNGCNRKMGEDKKDKKWDHVRHIPVALLAAD